MLFKRGLEPLHERRARMLTALMRHRRVRLYRFSLLENFKGSAAPEGPDFLPSVEFILDATFPHLFFWYEINAAHSD